MTREDPADTPAFACCSAGIGRWLWVAWASEADARASAPAMATGYEKSAASAEAKVAERFGPDLTRLPAKWASGHARGGGSGPGRSVGGGGEAKPKSRFGRRPPKRADAPVRLAFLYAVDDRHPPDAFGDVAVARHRIVKENARKIYVECDPFDEEAWARRDEGATEPAPKPPTIAVDRFALRSEGRFPCAGAHRGTTFYASEEDGLRDVQAALTAAHPWCATLGVRFPCSAGTIKAAYRRLARTTHPDIGGDPEAFRAVERAYRAALAYFSEAGDAPA